MTAMSATNGVRSCTRFPPFVDSAAATLGGAALR
jgi:hypothetical protein